MTSEAAPATVEEAQSPAEPSDTFRAPESSVHSRRTGSDGTAAVSQVDEEAFEGDVGPVMREREGTEPVSLASPAGTDHPAAAEPAGDAGRPALKGEPVEIELLLLSGKRKRWTFGTEETVAEVKDQVWHDWPDGALQYWTKGDPAPTSVNRLRLLHLGRFLHDASTLSAVGLKPTPDFPGPLVVHLHIRTLESPQHSHHSPKKKKKVEQQSTHDENRSCSCCIIA
ncbi:ubiquitin like superfamily protein [Rhodotorula toruloides]|uniref:Ubiquitin like superfamily protein n=1 Tax=Rhodotorula toruloides TaxID=5286 RepID=A0A511KJV6_RHOTO|nr:ubiquitin like superfamily protein [Rhodotorula toruloides]